MGRSQSLTRTHWPLAIKAIRKTNNMKRHLKRIITKLAVLIVERQGSETTAPVEDATPATPVEAAEPAASAEPTTPTEPKNPNDALVEAYKDALQALSRGEHLRSDYAADLQYAFENYDDQAVHQIVTEHDGVLKPMQDFNEALYQAYGAPMNRLDFMSFVIVANKCSESLEAITAQMIEELVVDYLQETTGDEGDFGLDFELQLLSAGGKYLYPPVSILGQPSETSIFGSKMKNIAAALRETGFGPSNDGYTGLAPISSKELELVQQIFEDESAEDTEEEDITLTTVPTYNIGEA